MFVGVVALRHVVFITGCHNSHIRSHSPLTSLQTVIGQSIVLLLHILFSYQLTNVTYSYFQTVLEVMSLGTIIVNTALIGISGPMQRLFPDLSTTQRILLIVVMEVNISSYSIHKIDIPLVARSYREEKLLQRNLNEQSHCEANLTFRLAITKINHQFFSYI